MVTEAIRKVMTLFMQLMWKAVRPEDLKLGDHIYTYRIHGLYSHHGIYVGNGYVIHFTRTEDKRSICPSLSKTGHKQQNCPNFPECENQKNIKHGVVKTCLDCFHRDDKRLRSLHCYGYGWPQLWSMLARPGTCTTLAYAKSRDQVVEKAIKLHTNGTFGNYDLMKNNCEHFALFCTIDIRKSGQTAFANNCERKIMEAKEWIMRLLQIN